MGTNTKLIFTGNAGFGSIEVRKVYPKSQAYDLFGPEPYTVGYYVTYTSVRDIPPEGSVLVRYKYAQPEKVEIQMQSRNIFDLLFDGVLVLQYRESNWILPEQK
jgi:hypothetical protein